MESRLERPVLVCLVDDDTRRHAGRPKSRPRRAAQAMPRQGGVRLGVRMRVPGQSRDDAGPIADRGGRRGSPRMPGFVARNRHRPTARQDLHSVRKTVQRQALRRPRQDAKQMRVPEAAGRVRQDCRVAEELRSGIHRRRRNRLCRSGVRGPEDIA